MSGPARRDLVWNAVLEMLISGQTPIQLRDIQSYIDGDVSDRTVRRTMNAMQSFGWLEKDSEGGHFWFPGPKARDYLKKRTDLASQSDTIADAVATVDVHASRTDMVRRRRELLQEILKFIQEGGEVTPGEIGKRFYQDATVGYWSEQSWWKNFVYPALSEIELVETGGKGSHVWFYVGDAP